MVQYKLTRKCKGDVIKSSQIVKATIAIYKTHRKVKPVQKMRTYDREPIPKVERNLVCYNQKWKCNLCDNMFKCSIIIDHIRPLFLGGANKLDNYQGLCDICNKIKTDVIDKKLYKSFTSGEMTEKDLTVDNILSMQRDYYNSKNYDMFI